MMILSMRLLEVEEMKNKEKYAKEIVEIACSGDVLAVSKVTGKPISCKNIRCEDCNRCNDLPICEKKRLREWAESDYIEKPVISKRDRAFLDFLMEKYKYIARDKNDILCVYETESFKKGVYWYWGDGSYFRLNPHFDIDFPMVKWSDDSPWLIEDLKKLEVVEDYGAD